MYVFVNVDCGVERCGYPPPFFYGVNLGRYRLTTFFLSIGYLQLSTQKPGFIPTKFFNYFHLEPQIPGFLCRVPVFLQVQADLFPELDLCLMPDLTNLP